jgi:L-2,4-diaminobutyrate decarboxylase
MALFSDYFNPEGDPKPNPGLKSSPSTRPFSALPLVTSIRHQGMKKVVQRLRAPLLAVKQAAVKIKDEPEMELCLEPDTGILCFRVKPEGISEKKLNVLQEYVFEEILSKGERTISKTKLGEQTVLRLVAVSPLLTSEHLMETVAHVQEIARQHTK